MNLNSTHKELVSLVTATITTVSNNNSNQRRHHHDENFNSEQRDSLANSDHSLSLPGRKRQFAHSAHDYVDGDSYVKLYVLGIPRTGTEQEIRSLFVEYGNIVEVVLLKDKRTGQQGGKLWDGREVALKRFYEHSYKRVKQFMNEIEILTYLSHPNLVTLYGCTSCKSQELLLVYEYIPNGTVADHLHGNRAKDGSVSWPIRMNIVIETASALAYLHASDIIHHDVKTNNILLDKNFCVKVADFGLSRLFPVENVYKNRGSGFVQFSHKDMAVAAMNALNGNFIMRGHDQPLIVRFADPKKPRMREPNNMEVNDIYCLCKGQQPSLYLALLKLQLNTRKRNNCKFGGSSIGSRFQESVVRVYLLQATTIS